MTMSDWIYYPLLYLLGLPLALFAWSSRLRNLGRRIPYHGHQPLLRLAFRATGIFVLLLGLYGVWVMAPGTLPPFSR